MTKKLIAIASLLAFASIGFGQATLSSTTLGAALAGQSVTSPNNTTVTLASTSTMLSSGPNNQINTVLYVDKELMNVLTVIDSTHVTVRRAQGLGSSTLATSHASGAKVYFANTTTYSATAGYQQVASRYFRNEGPEAEVSGACTAANLLVLPIIYLHTGNVYTCPSGGQYIQIGIGSMNPFSQARYSAYCTTTAGSAETDWLNNLACSGATSSLPRNVVSQNGTLYNLQATSSANFVGTGGSVLTLVINGTATAVACTPAAGAKTCSDTTHSVYVKAGDVLAFSFLSSTSDTAANITASIQQY